EHPSRTFSHVPCRVPKHPRKAFAELWIHQDIRIFGQHSDGRMVQIIEQPRALSEQAPQYRILLSGGYTSQGQSKCNSNSRILCRFSLEASPTLANATHIDALARAVTCGSPSFFRRNGIASLAGGPKRPSTATRHCHSRSDTSALFRASTTSGTPAFPPAARASGRRRV